ncbi:tyrosine-type recombinase/integrase [Nocardioides sp. Bht2]|uniref:tyrosine-type recombinase/integrase n=1 Tax=Nocardioides sp. Bht2 TaxID=3392297 RepID=UPI0039B520E8
MADTQRVTVAIGPPTWTVVDQRYTIVEPVEVFLEFLRQSDYSHNTVKSYARALALWWSFLEGRDGSWQQVHLRDFGSFMQAVRAGTVGVGVTALPEVTAVSDATVAVRMRAVMSFYRFHAANGVEVAAALYEKVRAPGSAYLPFLEHIARREGRTVSRLRLRTTRSETPILLPSQITGLMEHEAVWDPSTATWLGDLRYRLFWAFLAETGARLGETLSVRHCDWVTSRGGTPFVRLTPTDNHPHHHRLKTGARKVFISTRLDRLYGEFVWALCEAGAESRIPDWDNGYVFVNTLREPLYAPLRSESVYAHLRSLKRRGLDLPQRMTPHWFRHTHATALLLADVPLHVVSRRLGHRDVQTTINTYGHVTEDAELASLANWQDFTRGWVSSAELAP